MVWSALARFFFDLQPGHQARPCNLVGGKKGVVAVIPLNQLPSRPPTPHDTRLLKL